jgi:hypothetical protein
MVSRRASGGPFVSCDVPGANHVSPKWPSTVSRVVVVLGGHVESSAGISACVTRQVAVEPSGPANGGWAESCRTDFAPAVADLGVRCYRPHAGIGSDPPRIAARPRGTRILSHSSEPMIALLCGFPGDVPAQGHSAPHSRYQSLQQRCICSWLGSHAVSWRPSPCG